MYLRRIKVHYELGGSWTPCPIKWLDSFAMRNFTNDPIFDDTLPVTDGELQVGTRVPLDRLRATMEDWFKRKSYLPQGSKLALHEETP
jgi:hypothetical protein